MDSIIRNLRVICQLCGKVKNLDATEPIGQEPRWSAYPLSNFIDETEPFSDYEIWICPDCHNTVISDQHPSFDEDGVEYIETEYDHEKLQELVIISLKSREEMRGSV